MGRLNQILMVVHFFDCSLDRPVRNSGHQSELRIPCVRSGRQSEFLKVIPVVWARSLSFVPQTFDILDAHT